MRPKYYSTTNPKIESYVQALLNVERDETLQFVLQESRKHGTPPLQVTPIDGRHLEVLARLVNPTKIVEIGTLCGYSAVHLCRALDENGTLWTIEKSEHHHGVTKETFQKLKFKNKVEFLLGSAEEVLPKIEPHGPFDMVFIDANKDSYPFYFQWAEKNLRKGGLLVADNVFLFGYIAEEKCSNDALEQLRLHMQTFNELASKSPHFVTTFLPTGEGLLVGVKV